MENNETNRRRIAKMTMESFTSQELNDALRYELCERYKREPYLFDSTVVELEAEPDLLDTLKSTVEWLHTGKVDGVGFDEQSIIDDLVEAITKAEGGE